MNRLLTYKKDDAGSLTIFGLFVFLMILVISGVAVDMMNYERQRVGVQNTLDTAIVAAAALNQEADTDAEVEALVKEFFTKAGYSEDIVTVNSNIEVPAGGDEETLRTVSAVVDFDLETMFMNMVGVESLPGAVGGGAREGQQLIEIAMVLDISGSMGWGTKLQNMKDAAKEFVTFVLDNNGTDRVMISIIPYNMQVQMSEDLMGRLNIANSMETVLNPPAYPGAIVDYQTQNTQARCARFLDADFDTRRLSAGPNLEPSAKFSRGSNDYAQSTGAQFWCGEGYPEMLLYQNNETVLHNHIDSLTARGMTSIDYGMKWATGVLDPSFRPVVASMLADTQDPDNPVNLVPNNVAGHPVDYGTPDVYKYIVVMTDGANTQHLDLKDEFKSGPSRIWWSDTLSKTDDTDGVEFDGYLVYMPENSLAERWYRPRSPFTDDDDEYISETAFVALTDAEQWDYHRVYNRFDVRDAANYFFQYSDWPARQAHNAAEVDTGGYAVADINLARICDSAQENEWIEVFAVAFEAPEGGVNALSRCVESKPGNFFDVAGTDISTAFAAIAAQISQLRLTQ